MLGDLDRRVLEDRELLGDARREPPQYLDVERQLRHLERRRQRRRVDLQRIGLVAAEHEAAALVANVDVRVDHPRDRELGDDARDRLGDEELMARRHDLQRRAEGFRDDPRPRSRRVDHHARGDRALGRAHSFDAWRADLKAGGGRVRQQDGAHLLRRAAIADRQLRRLDVAVGRAPGDGGDAALAQDRQPASRLGGRDEVDRDADLAAPLDLTTELGGIALVARDLEGAALGEPQRLAGLVGERRELHDRATGDGGEGGGGTHLTAEPGGTRRSLGGETGTIQESDPQTVPGEVIGDARAEGARADDDRVRRVDHRLGSLSRGACRAA